MKRALDIRRCGDWSAAGAIDRVTLAADDRHRRRLVMTGEAGTRFLLEHPDFDLLTTPVNAASVQDEAARTMDARVPESALVPPLTSLRG